MAERVTGTAISEKLEAAGYDAGLTALRCAVAKCVTAKSQAASESALWLMLKGDRALAATAMRVVISACTPAGAALPDAPIKPSPAAGRNLVVSAAAALVSDRRRAIEKTIKERLCWPDGSLVATSTRGDLLARRRSGAYEAELAKHLLGRFKHITDRHITVGSLISSKDLEDLDRAAKDVAQDAIVH